MATVSVTRKESILDQIDQLRHRIEQRAYELFRGRDGGSNPTADWLAAEQELVWKPAVELRLGEVLQRFDQQVIGGANVAWVARAFVPRIGRSDEATDERLIARFKQPVVLSYRPRTDGMVNLHGLAHIEKLAGFAHKA